MFKGAMKGDLRLIASELNLIVDDKMTVMSLNELIEKSDIYKTKPEYVRDIASTIIENRKLEEQRSIEIERLKLERSKNELELAKIRNEGKSDSGESDIKSESLDQIIKSIRTLTVKIPSRPEGWGLFFSSLERAFNTKNVLDQYKAEILLNLIGDKASNIITYLQGKDITDYEKIKTLVLREYEPTPYSCLESFRKAVKQPHETHVQFASRLVTSWDYYLKLRKVSDYETLKQLIVSDKLFQTLDKETASFISVRQGDSWFPPNDLGKEIDLFFTSRGKNITESSSTNRRYNKTSNVFLAEIKNAKCSLCNSNEKHALYFCPQFKKLSVRDRIEVVKKNKACFKCLKYNCAASTCSARNCFCGLPHNTLIHYPRDEKLNNKSGTKPEFKPREPLPHGIKSDSNSMSETDNSIVASGFVKNKVKSVLLSTARILMKDKFSEYQEIRCLLDVGSQSCLLTSQCANRLQLKITKTNTIISGLDDAVTSVKGRVEATIANRDRSFEREINLLVVKKITDLIPQRTLQVSVDENISNLIELADYRFNIPDKIDMLIGAEIFYELLRPGQIICPNSKLLLQNTVFGYVASGCVEQETEVKSHHCGLILEDDLNKTLKKFWEIETVDVELPKSREHALCEEHYANTHFRDETGRYVVKIPLKENPSCLGKSKDVALKRLRSLWTRLDRDPNYLHLYRDFLNQYRELGHMREVNELEEPTTTYYAPHHGIYRPEKSTTKLRVVFNCSSRSTNGISLNDLQLNGGVIQNDLFTIMISFREHVYAFTADVRMMYRMIKIDPSQYALQRIVWKNSPEEEPKTYELLTVTYGTVSAPYLAMRTLQQLSKDEEQKYPKASPVLRNHFYMDDVLSGAPTIEEAKELQRQLIAIMQEAGMELHKWFTNFSNPSLTHDNSYVFDCDIETKTLGVSWNPKADCFTFRVEVYLNHSYTKRQVLSTIARIFDPLGLLGPIIAKAKIIMQKLWRLNLDWNDELPELECQEWHQFLVSLKSVNNIKIMRRIVIENPINVEIHGFADASEHCYGATVFCKSSDSQGNILVKLVTSKSRVAPIKCLTIPRLELCAAVLLSQLVKKVLVALEVTVNTVYWWSDSTIVLAWIQKDPIDLKQFVRSRVAVIQENSSPEQWRHISSEENPADILSRGIDPDKLLHCKLWWHGPSVLMNADYPRHSIVPESNCEISAEFKNSTKNFHLSNGFNITVEQFLNELLTLSNIYVTILRILSFIFRFLDNCRQTRKRSGPLEAAELKRAEISLIKMAQTKYVQEQMNSKKGLRASPIANLNPFLDKDGILRVGGRLGNSELNYDRKYPILLPPKHRITDLIVNFYHLKYLHSGPQALLHQIRQKFWLINGRSTCRKIVHNCVTCFKAKPQVMDQLMGDLPEERVKKSFPFNITGADFCGPFYIKYKGQRKGVYHKIYVCIFICFVTKAMHLELVSDMTSASFIAALKRFIFRRGKCAKIFTDNAKNFVGANAELKKLQKLVQYPDDKLADFMSSEGIDWKFLPPRAPNFGGIWEAGVKSIKYYLKRVVGNSKLTYEEFLTVLIQVEGMLNSRPLVPLSADINDLNVLTPSHFLIGRTITSMVEPDLTNIDENRLNHWQKLTKFIQQIWKRWSSDYLSNLQQRSKWKFEKNNVEVGDLVIIKEDNLPPCQWSMGRICATYPGKDSKVRVVEVKTAAGTYKRPITKLCLLPMCK